MARQGRPVQHARDRSAEQTTRESPPASNMPKGFRRSRNFGVAHPNCKHRQRLTLLRMGLKPGAMAPCTTGMQPSTQPRLSERPKLQCRCCGAAMVIVRRRIAPQASKGGAAGPPGAAREGQMT